MRRSIKAYNATQGVHESPTTGYNETTTYAFLRLVASTIANYGSIVPTPNADAFCDAHPQLMSKQVLRLFYSPQRRADPAAKTQFVAPDLAQLP